MKSGPLGGFREGQDGGGQGPGLSMVGETHAGAPQTLRSPVSARHCPQGKSSTGERHFGVSEEMRALLFNSECLSRRLLIPAWSQDPPWVYARTHTRMSWGETSVLS